MNLLTLHRYLRLIPFDVSTEQGRSDERYRLAVLTMAANVLSRGVAMVVMVLTVSLTIPYLGAERFGVWMTIASFVGMLSFLDLGVGNALTNKVSQVAAQNSPDALRRTISGGLGFLFILGCTIGILLFLLTSILPWDKIIKVKDVAVSTEVLNTAAIFSILFGFSLFSNGIQRVFAGLQRAFESHLVSLAGSCFSLLALWIATKQEASIPYLLAATLGVQSLANLGLLIILAKRSLFTLKRIADHTRLEAHHLIHVGGLFFILQIGTMVGWGADSLIIASTLGAAQVAAFAIVQRLFQFVIQPMSIMNAPLWGAYADANSRGEKRFIKKTLISSIYSTGIYSVAAFILILISGEYLVKVWTGNSLILSFYFLAAYGTWSVLEALSNSFAMFMNGCNIVRPQVFGVLSLITLSIPMKILAINYYGLTGMLTGFIMVYCLNIIFWYGFVFRKEIKSKIFKG